MHTGTASQTPATYVVYDVETTTRSPIGFAASPFCTENALVCSGFKYNDGIGDDVSFTGHHWRTHRDAKLVVGANLKFDLLWGARATGTSPAKLVQGMRVWDVCLAEYILQRQRIRMPSLERCAELRGITDRKDEVVKVAIASGICPSTIEPTHLADYNRQDLVLTEKVFLSQFQEAADRDMLPLLWSQMNGLVATCEMEHWGIKVDRNKLEKLRDEYSIELAIQRTVFQTGVKLAAGEHQSKGLESYTRVLHEKFENGWMSPDDALSSTRELSLLLFGGEVTVTLRELVGKYKNGKDKYKNRDVKKYYPGIWEPKAYGLKKNKLGWYPVDDDVLKSLMTDVLTAPIISSIRLYRDANKQLGTYVDGVSKSIWPGDYIHCNFNHTVTLTGRLSCSNPNLQNQTDGEIKKVYIPRRHDGILIEYDYAQLEVVGLAVLSQDPQLIDDLKNGRDIHTELYVDMYHRHPTPVERKRFKPLTFGLIYGAGANTLAENGGIPLSEAKKFMYTFYSRYTGVYQYHKEMQEKAKALREVGDTKTEKGIPAGKYVYRTATGREYEFREYDNEYKHDVSFSPTELKNWPVQGFATGDVVPLVLGYVVRELTASEWYGKILPIVTVHDSIMFEVLDKRDIVDARNYLDKLMSNTRSLVMERFGFDPGLDFHTESKVGYNWKELA